MDSRTFLIVTLAYILCHGLTSLVVAPVQRIFLPDKTVFASLVFLPHGVRVLATWAFVWRAIPPLILGAAIAAFLFMPAEDFNFLEPLLLESIMAGAVCAFLAFEVVKLTGMDLYARGRRWLSWKGMILIGTIASLINSVAQTLIYSGLIGPGELFEVLVIYAVGDIIGLILCMVALMFVFRWSRMLRRARN